MLFLTKPYHCRHHVRGYLVAAGALIFAQDGRDVVAALLQYDGYDYLSGSAGQEWIERFTDPDPDLLPAVR